MGVRRAARRAGRLCITFHDNDVFPFDADDATRRDRSATKSAADAAGLVIEMVTTNTFSHPVFMTAA